MNVIYDRSFLILTLINGISYVGDTLGELAVAHSDPQICWHEYLSSFCEWPRTPLFLLLAASWTCELGGAFESDCEDEQYMILLILITCALKEWGVTSLSRSLNWTGPISQFPIIHRFYLSYWTLHFSVASNEYAKHEIEMLRACHRTCFYYYVWCLLCVMVEFITGEHYSCNRTVVIVTTELLMLHCYANIINSYSWL